MSHFVQIATQIRERELLLAALRDLNLPFECGVNLTVRGFLGNCEQADIVVHASEKYDIGLRRQGEEYEVIADWWGVEKHSPLRQQSFVEQLSQRYSYHLVKQQARDQYLLVEEEEELENGDIVLVLSERG